MKNSKTQTEKPAPKVKTEQAVVAVAPEAKTKKPSSPAKAPYKSKIVEPKAVVSTTEITPSARIGLTAGSIWHYLDKHGGTPVAQLIRELHEEEKIIQRSIGWLAQEQKITLNIVERVEIVSLK